MYSVPNGYKIKEMLLNPTSSLELSVAVGMSHLTMAVPRRSSVPATMFSGHWIAGGSVSEETWGGGNTHFRGRRERDEGRDTRQMLDLI